MSNTKQIVEAILQSARAAAVPLANASTAVKNKALRSAAEALMDNQRAIEIANADDLEAGRKAGLSAAMLDRLMLNEGRIAELAQSLEDVSKLPDPVGRTVRSWTRPNGLKVSLKRIPLGVIVMIFESRPNVTTDAAGLCLKSGNVVVLRGGKEALQSNLALAAAVSQGIESAGLPREAVQVLPIRDRAAVKLLVQADGLVDLVIPRGGEGLIRRVVAEAHVPVLKHYKGVCHVYLHADAKVGDSRRIVLNSKVQRPGVCNAAETLLVHAKAAKRVLPSLAAALREAGVELRGCKRTRELAPFAKRAKADDYGREFLDLVLAVKVVDSLDEAIDHIRQYSSDHTEAIITNDAQAAERFLNEVCSSTVLHNASTRFADGGQLGLGAEIGISTSRLHAYGPMGLEALTIPRFVVRGQGQIRG